MDESGTIIQETEYYAFGLPIQRSGSDKNKYLYNGKEKQPQTEWLDYGARMYDPTIGRWMVVDPLSELDFNQSGYMYVSGNPINRIDLYGMTDTTYVIKPGTTNNTLPPVTVTAKRNNPLNNSIAENWSIAYVRNKSTYGEASPYRKHFQAGGNIAAAVAVAPLAGMALAEGAATASAVRYSWSGLSRLQQLRRLSAGRIYLQAASVKGLINLGGQLYANSLKGEQKFDILGLGFDMFGSNLAAAAVGGIGEAGYNFQSGSFYAERTPTDLGILKATVGYGLGAFGESVTGLGLGNTFSKLVEPAIKVYEETTLHYAEQWGQPIYK